MMILLILKPTQEDFYQVSSECKLEGENRNPRDASFIPLYKGTPENPKHLLRIEFKDGRGKAIYEE